MTRLGSLCSGAGGLDLAVEAVFGARTAWHCELPQLTDKSGRTRRNTAVDVLAARWPGVPNHGDLTATDWAAVEPVEIVCAGWPCQPWSTAGKKLGAADERAIWPDIAAAIRVVRPRIVVLENVTDVLARGEFTRVADSLAALGYGLRWTCLRASDVGACHRRDRIFIVATLADADSRGLAQRAQCWDPPAKSELAASQWRDADRRGGNAVELLLPTPRTVNSKSRRAMTASTNNGRRSGGGQSSPPGLEEIVQLMAGYWPENLPPLNELPPRTVELLPTPAAADGERGPDFARAGREGSGGDDLVTICARATRNRGSNWGKYEPAIRRWEALTRPAPPPTEPNTKGKPRLNPVFSEWMMGWPAGWVTDIPGVSRNDQLRIIGNGVVPQQAITALRWLMSVEVAA